MMCSNGNHAFFITHFGIINYEEEAVCTNIFYTTQISGYYKVSNCSKNFKGHLKVMVLPSTLVIENDVLLVGRLLVKIMHVKHDFHFILS